MPSTIHVCHRCGIAIARRQNGTLVLLIPATQAKDGKVAVECLCGRTIWLRVPEKVKEAA